MLKDYEILKNGVIHYTGTDRVSYDSEYIKNSYDKYGEASRNLSWLRLGFILAHCKPLNSIMDIGYGNGDFLNVAKQYGIKCYGNDISGYPIPSGCKFVSDITTEKVDCITFFDSLEHYETIDFVSKLQARIICISVPNCISGSNDKWFEIWKHRRVGEHLWHFNLTSLSAFMLENGYRVIDFGNHENSIRKSTESGNILTAIFRKI